MSDVVERAERYVATVRTINNANACALMTELVAELKAARAEVERLRDRLLVDQSTGRYMCCGTDGLRADPFHATGCPKGEAR